MGELYVINIHSSSYMLSAQYNINNGQANTYPVRVQPLYSQKNHASKLHLFVTFTTRENKTLDHCYSNITNAFSAEPQPHIGKSDHLAIRFKQVYNKRLKIQPVTVRTITTRTTSASEQDNLQRCLESTAWNMKEATNSMYLSCSLMLKHLLHLSYKALCCLL